MSASYSKCGQVWMLMKKLYLLFAVLLLVFSAIACTPSVDNPADFEQTTENPTEQWFKPEADTRTLNDSSMPQFSGKPRLIVVQDGEVDDKNSLVHTLLYANDIDIEGIVQTSSVLHYSGDGAVAAKRWMGTDWVYDYLDAYASVYENLIVHDPNYPDPEYLRSVTMVGNIKRPNDTEEETDGSNLIMERILVTDERPLYIEIGGGVNTVARALMSIEETYKDTAEWNELYARICENVICFSFGVQDSSYTDYIQPNWPRMRFVDVSGTANAYGYKWGSVQTLSALSKEHLSSEWMKENLLDGTGVLLDHYVTWGDGTYLEGEADSDQYGINEDLLNTKGWWGTYKHQRYDFLSEGDSPAWMALVPNGLRTLEDLSYSGWAGRFESQENGAIRYFNSADGVGMSIWVAAIQSDFAMRAKWCVADSYDKANHLPSACVLEGTNLTAEPGETVVLHSSATDPDGDAVRFAWYQDPYSDTYIEWLDEFEEIITIAISTDNDTASFVVPEDAKSGDTIHIILECIDSGGTNPSAFQRIIVKVK